MSHISLQYSSSGLSSWKLEPQGTEIKWGTDHNFDKLEISFMNTPMQGYIILNQCVHVYLFFLGKENRTKSTSISTEDFL